MVVVVVVVTVVEYWLNGTNEYFHLRHFRTLPLKSKYQVYNYFQTFITKWVPNFITKWVSNIITKRVDFITKWVSNIITKRVDFITKWVVYYKVGPNSREIPSTTILCSAYGQ